MIAGICGFSWSGSGAVLDYLMEFQENQVYTPEFIIAYHPDGLRDLDLNLNENCAKFLSSGVAIPRFRNVADSLLDELTNGKARKLTEEYMNQLIQAKWVGLEQGHELLRSRWLYRNIGMRIRNGIITRLPLEFCWKHKPYPLAEMVFSIRPDDFMRKTQDYIGQVLKAAGLDTNRNIVLNQPFPGNNPVPYMKYFTESKAIVVDRDPRDVFVFLKYVFPGHSYSVPLQDVETFCDYYLHMHKDLSETLDDPSVLYLWFEDLIYRYEETTAKIRSFLNLNEHSEPRRYFVPEESEANTQVFRHFGKKEEIDIIERKLSHFLYDFSGIESRHTEGEVFDDNPKSKGFSLKS